MSISGEDNEVILNASLSNSPDSTDVTGESSRVFFEKLSEIVSMNSNAVKINIDEIAARLQNGSSTTSTSSSKTNGSTVHHGSSNPDPSIISNHNPAMQLSCAECGVTKDNSEDMEIHIKTEHLKWLPFQCPICLCERASDSQMREHIHSSHQKNMGKFIYVDNVVAKRKLQVLMDKSFSLNVSKRITAKHGGSSTSTSPYSPPSYRGIASTPSSGRNTSTSNGSATSNVATTASAIVNQHKEKEKQQAQAAADFLKLLDFSVQNGGDTSARESPKPSSSTKSSSSSRKRPYVPTSATESITTMDLGPSSTADASAFLATLNSFSHAQTPENEENDQPSFSLDDLNIDSSSTLATLFGGGAKQVKYEEPDATTDSMDDALDGLNPISVLDNVAALFGTTPDRTVEETPKKGSSISKKRVLGECSKCQKPVTAGARQMHMFFHLAKDESIFRFRCKHEGCAIEHYRKDQMENHQSKAHGRIDPEMMEDRSLELFQKCQELNHELFVAHRHGRHGASPHTWSGGSADMAGYQDLSMELLGTKSGTIPGPTAAKAEIVYAAQQAANAQRSAQKSKLLLSGTPTLTGTGSPSTNGFGPLKLVPDEDHPLQCRLCGKTMQNRIRGFHILWHMAKDKGINRYTCKYCNFGHDRSQSVQVHGKKEHATDDCVEDRIGEYQDDVKEMSEACFGISSLFAQESKRKNKFPAAPPRETKDPLSLVSLVCGSSPLVSEQVSEQDDEASNDTSDITITESKPLLLMDDEMIEDEDLEQDVKPSLEPELEEEQEQEEEELEEDDEGEEEEMTPVTSAKSKKRRRAFNMRAKKSKKQKEDAVVARSVSILIGGAQFYKKKVSEGCFCEKCGKPMNSRLPEHAYTHLNGVELYSCSVCEFGSQCKDTVMKHMQMMHPECIDRCVDNRLGHIKEIKNMLRECFPAFFIDHPLPTRADIEKLKILAMGGDLKLGCIEEYLREECNSERSSVAPEDEEMEEESEDQMEEDLVASE